MADEQSLPPDHDTVNRHANPSADGKTSPGRGGDIDISWPLERPTEPGDWTPEVDASIRKDSMAIHAESTIPFTQLLPGRARSQSGIGSRSFILGLVLGLSIHMGIDAALYLDESPPSPMWRVYFLLGALSIFHFLEFWTHARYNVPKANISTFLLFDNGWQYTAANIATLVETIVTSLIFPEWQAQFSHPRIQQCAFVVMVLGQTCRSVAMAHAGTSFDHKVQMRKAKDHYLVTTGIYRFLRHPSYFGYFWWALGLQVVLGNVFCFWIYAFVLWRFFSRRIFRKPASPSSVSSPSKRANRVKKRVFFTI